MDALVQLADKSLPFAVFVSILAAIVLITGFITFYKAFNKILNRKFSLEVAGQKLKVGESSEETSTSDPGQAPKSLNFQKLCFILQTAITKSVQTGYKNCSLRQELYENQLHYLRDQLAFLQISALSPLQDTQTVANQELANLVLKVSTEKVIITYIKNIFIEDRLAELSQDELLEKHRKFIDSSYERLRKEVIQTLNMEAYRALQDEVIKCLETYVLDFKKILSDSLAHAWKEAKKYLEDVGQQNADLSNTINGLLMSYLEELKDSEKLPENWIEREVNTPPAKLVGGA